MANCSITVRQRLKGLLITNVWYAGSGIDPATHGQALADMFWDAYNTHLIGILSNQWTYESVGVRDLDTAAQNTFDFIPTQGQLSGGGNIDTLATQTSLFIRLIANSNKPNRGRKFVRGVAEADLSSGDFTSGAVAAGNNFGNAVKSGIPVVEGNSGLLIARVDPVTKLITAANLVTTIETINLPRSLSRSSRRIPR